ncbi:NAD(P)/FAD-dependent oxidoreductase, partial [Methanobrevibacter sp. OttesenSCG-928-I08]|nr:NAD(P)/FAD-dependent oxidoreductase [Methanobrevibacter sp. OttesenSCG-928-I08]
MKKFKVAIVGGGPAGITAAIATSLKLNEPVVILEKTDSLGKKLLLTGGGRCNITNSTPIKTQLKIFNNKNFLKHSFYTFSNEKLLDLFESKGLEFKIENEKVFPISNDSNSVLDILKEYLDELKVEIKLNYNVSDIEHINDEFVINNEIIASNIIIATGGITYPQTGSSGDGYKLSKKLNHSITDIKKGLVPLLVDNTQLNRLSGIKLENVEISYNNFKTNKDILISHFGLSGPGILDISNKISADIDYNILNNATPNFKDIFINIDFCPNLNQEEINQKITEDSQLKGKTKIKNYLKVFIPKNFIDFFLNTIDIDKNKTMSNISKKEKITITNNLKRLKIEINGFYENLSKITIGGIFLDEINPKTMESKKINNLYFAGEVLDVVGPTGGYNLQIAFSTGYLAGNS